MRPPWRVMAAHSGVLPVVLSLLFGADSILASWFTGRILDEYALLVAFEGFVEASTMNKVTIRHDKRLVVTRFEGPIDYLDVMQWMDQSLQDDSFSRDYDGIVDLRAASFKSVRAEKAELLAFYMIENDFTRGKWVVLVAAPMETALAVIYGDLAARQHPIEIFSTLRAASVFLNKDLSGLDLE